MAPSAPVLSLVALVLRGDELAWRELVQRIAPLVERIVARSRRLGPLRGSDDHRRDVLVRVLDRLHRRDFRALHSAPAWLEKHRGKTFEDWLTIVVTNVIRDHVTDKLGPRQADGGGGNKRLVNTLASLLEEDEPLARVDPRMTDRQTARRVLELARECLDADQLAALELWMRGCEFDEIAAALRLASDDAARKVVRAALARLRRRLAV